jgi:LPXTG-site transpeptidase (sortase) family protein
VHILPMCLRKSQLKNKLASLSLYTKIGLGLLALSLFLVLFFYFPLIKKEFSYFVDKPNTDVLVSLTDSQTENKNVNQKIKVIVAADKDFSVVIPKIGVNTKVVKDVDPFSSQTYQQALTQGVAHAKGSAYPGEIGYSFLFAHSSDNIYNANKYNSVFYLLTKLTKGDLFYLVYDNVIYKYYVTDTRIVNPKEITYLNGKTDKKLSVLMTCWPAGTTLKRFIVLGELVEE